MTGVVRAFHVAWLGLLWLGFGLPRAGALPVPEPGLVMQGRIVDLRSGVPVRLTQGVLVWTVEPVAPGAAVNLTVPLGQGDSAMDYTIAVPFETRTVSGAGLGSSPGTLELLPAGASYRRARVTWNGLPLALASPSQGQFGFGPSDRGRTDRVDLLLTAGGNADSDQDGLPDVWEFQTFGDLSRNGAGDLDGDGASDATEFASGTDPVSASSVLRQTPEGVRIQWDVAGTNGPVGRVVRWLGGPVGSGVTNNVFSWTPSEAQGPSTNEVEVSVTDGSAVTTNRFTVVVTEVNVAPVFVGLTNAAIPELTLYSQALGATDVDLPTQALAFALVSGPVGAVVEGGVFRWTPTEAQGPSTNEVRVSVTDGVAVTTASFLLTVRGGGGMEVPEFAGLPILESGAIRLAIRGVGRVRVQTSDDLTRWTTVEVLTLEAGLVREWSEQTANDAFRAYRLVRE